MDTVRKMSNESALATLARIKTIDVRLERAEEERKSALERAAKNEKEINELNLLRDMISDDLDVLAPDNFDGTDLDRIYGYALVEGPLSSDPSRKPWHRA